MSQEMPSIRDELRTPRSAAVAGVIFSVLLIATLALVRLSISPDPLGSASEMKAHSKAIALAFNLVPFTGIAFLWFIAVVRDRLGEREDRFFVTVFLGSGYLFIATLFLTASLAGGLLTVLGNAPEALVKSGAYGLGRAQIYQTSHVYAMRMAGVFMITTCTLGLRTRIFPHWMTFLGYALAAILLLSAGTIDWIPFVFPLWVLLISVHILLDSYRGQHVDWAEGARAQGQPPGGPHRS